MTKILQIFAPIALFKLKTEPYPPPLIFGFLEKILEEKGYEVSSIDANNYCLFKFNKDEIAELIMTELLKDVKKIAPDAILMSSWTYGMPFTIQFIQEIRKRGKIPIILGGYNATMFPEHTLEVTGADYVFSGNNLFAFADSVDSMVQKKLSNRIIKQQKPLDVEKLPLVDFKSFHFQEKPKKFYLMSSFGCGFQCTYCSDRILWDKYLSFSVPRMLKQINLLKSIYNPVYIAFWESNISMNKRYGDEFLSSYDGSIKWFTYSRADGLNESLIRRMAEKNCHTVFLGMEHFDPTILAYYQKTKRIDKYLERFWTTLDLLTKYHITPVVSLVVGSTKETEASLNLISETVSRIRSVNEKAEFELSPLTLEIGTKMWNDFLKGDIKLFRTKDRGIMTKYSGIQPYSETYDDPRLAPQNFLFENETLDNQSYEQMITSFIKNFRKEVYVTSGVD